MMSPSDMYSQSTMSCLRIDSACTHTPEAHHNWACMLVHVPLRTRTNRMIEWAASSVWRHRLKASHSPLFFVFFFQFISYYKFTGILILVYTHMQKEFVRVAHGLWTG